jgi:hypothetical protein
MIKFSRTFEQEPKIMSRLRFISFVLLLTGIFVGTAAAQKKPAKKTPAKTTTSTAAKPTTGLVAPLEVRTARDKVDTQRINVTLFVDRLGPIAQAIEDFDTQAQAKAPAPAAASTNESNKQKVVAAIRNLREGLTALESEFRTSTALQKYLPSLQGITDLAIQSEDSAIAGKFVASKTPLRQAAQKLVDTLGVMPR